MKKSNLVPVVVSVVNGEKQTKHACGCGEVAGFVKHGKQGPSQKIHCINRGYVTKEFAANTGHELTPDQRGNCINLCNNFICLS